VHSNKQTPGAATLESIAAPAMKQANDALNQAVRMEFLARKIPLNTRYEIKIASDLGNMDEPAKREVWVHQIFPTRKTFLLITETTKVVIQDGAFKVEQKIEIVD